MSEDVNDSLNQANEQAIKLAQLLAGADDAVRESASEKLLRIVEDLQELTGKEILAALVPRLKDSIEAVRVNAVLSIGFMRNPQTIPILRQVLGKDTHPVKIAAIRALGEMRSKGPVETLLAIITRVKDDVLIAEAVHALGKLRDRRSIPYLKELLVHDSVDVVFATARTLCILGEDEGIHFLLECLTSQKDTARALAAQLLGEFGDSSHVQPLTERLFDESTDVRANVIEALGRIEAANAVPLLKAALGDVEPKIRANAAAALGKIGEVDCLEALCELLQDEYGPARLNAADAIGKLKDPSGVPYLIVLLGDELEEVRVAAVHALMSLAFWLDDLEAKSRLAIALAVSLEDSNEEVRAAAAETIGYVGIFDDEGLEALFKCLRDPSPNVIIAATASLGAIGDPRAADELKALLRLDNPLVRWNVVTSLGKLTFADKDDVMRQMMRDEDETVREAARLSLAF